MPLHVKLDINGHAIEELHIGRIKGGTNPDDVNTYLAVVGSEPLFIEQWKERGVEFTHRYGDMALVCVQKAIDAITKEDNKIGSSLGNIPRQVKMTKEQEQTFTNGINKGRKLARAGAIKLIEAHSLTGESAAGFLALCSCGEAIDSYQEHLTELIKGEDKTNFEAYLEEQLKDAEVKKAYEQGENK